MRELSFFVPVLVMELVPKKYVQKKKGYAYLINDFSQKKLQVTQDRRNRYVMLFLMSPTQQHSNTKTKHSFVWSRCHTQQKATEIWGLFLILLAYQAMAAQPRWPKSKGLLGRSNRLLLLGDLGRSASNSIIYQQQFNRRLRSEICPNTTKSNIDNSGLMHDDPS